MDMHQRRKRNPDNNPPPPTTRNDTNSKPWGNPVSPGKDNKKRLIYMTSLD